jgi:hypothetical protein
LEKLFEKIKVNSLKYKTKDLPKHKTPEYSLPALTAGIENQGLNNYVPNAGATILKNVISISANGANTGATFYQNREFTVLQDAYAIKWIFDKTVLSDNQYLFLTSSISKTVYGNYEWTNKAGWERIKSENIKLPIKANGNIDFEFMETFIAELEAERVAELKAERAAELSAYLKASGFDNYELSDEEKKALQEYEKLKWDSFNIEALFGKSTRGKRLKGADRISGELPFVTAGEANEGISAYISNKVEVFEKNTTTIDMFGSAKYRNYKYGADDHIAVVHTENVPMKASIFLTSSIHKAAHTGKFDYGHNFYAKDADALDIMLPVKNGHPDYDVMELLISAIQKLVIKDVVKYSDAKISVTKQVVQEKGEF